MQKLRCTGVGGQQSDEHRGALPALPAGLHPGHGRADRRVPGTTVLKILRRT